MHIYALKVPSLSVYFTATTINATYILHCVLLLMCLFRFYIVCLLLLFTREILYCN